MMMACLLAGGMHVKAADLSFTFNTGNYTRQAVQEALDEAGENKSVEITFAQGTYELTAPLLVHSNTTIKAQGATFKRVGEAVVNGYTMMKNTGSKETNNAGMQGSGYTLSHDITIIGGTFDGGDISKSNKPSNLVNFGHASDITVQGVTFRNCYGSHLLELSGVKDSVVKSCVFDGTGFRYNDADDQSEALQVDVCGEGLNGNFTADNTPCTNILITGNTVKDYPRGIGNHNVVAGHYNSYITITGNTITYTARKQKQGIFLNEFENSTVTGNVIEGFESGIQAFGGKNLTIKGNTVKNPGGNGISVMRTVSVKELSGNIVENAGGNGISVKSGCSVNTMQSNKITSGKNNGILVDDSGTVITSLTGNQISGVDGNGISVNGEAEVARLSGNTIKNVTGNAVRVASVVKLLDKNTITGAKANAIVVCNSAAKVQSVKKNTISASKGKAISVSEGTVTEITGNKITGTNEYAIKISGKTSKVSSVTGNEITDCKLQAISVSSGTSVDEISKNTVSGCSNHAIGITSKAKAKNVTDNTISSAGKCGIYISASGSRIENLTGNVIKDTKSHAVSAASKAYIGKASGNTITAPGGYGMTAVSASTIGTITGNTFTKCKNHAVYFGKGSVKTSITGNTFVSNKKSAVYIGKGIKATVRKNKISGYSQKYVQIFYTSTTKGRSTMKLKTVSSKSKTLTGTAPAKASVTVKAGKKTYKAKAKASGSFSVNTGKIKKGTKVVVTATDSGKNTLSVTVKVK